MRTKEEITKQLSEKNIEKIGIIQIELLLDIRMQNEQILQTLKDIKRDGIKTSII